MNEVYLEAFEVDENRLLCDLEGVITIYLCEVCQFENCVLKVVSNCNGTNGFYVNRPVKNLEFISNSEIPKIASTCKWPVVVNGNTVIAGLCSVARQIIKGSSDEEIFQLLGFKESCLAACSEVSIWTKFCEVDVIQTVREVLGNPRKYFCDGRISIPIDLLRFEQLMSEPLSTHNIYKLARIKSGDKSIKSSTKIEDLNLQHVFSKGPELTLSDVILYICFDLIFTTFGLKLIEKELKLSYNWFRNMQQQKLPKIKIEPKNKKIISAENLVIIKPEINSQSLCVFEPKKHQQKIFTKQIDLDNTLQILNSSTKIKPKNQQKLFGDESQIINWSDIPEEINPTKGALPAKRASRKQQQLESMLKPILQISKANDVIVDFCSGSGHLGLLIASCLPQCKVILVENKERSLSRANERVEKLKLKNVTLLQSNLDYFNFKFDIGVSLHACGVATDLVMQRCIENKAHFVCCPCCYGGIHNFYDLKYPRSDVFTSAGVGYKDFLNLAHAADQTHDESNPKTEQGYFCMDFVDTDRMFYAQQFGYEVFLGKLQPLTCTPKNNLLVGMNRR